MNEKLSVLLKTSRPVFWPVLPLVFLAGMKFADAQFSTIAVIQAILLSFPYCLFLYGINDVFDYHSDIINPRKTKQQIYGIVLEKKYRKLVIRLSMFFAGIMLAFSILTLNISNIIAMVTLLIFSYTYSASPLRTKTKPPFDSIWNGIFYFLAPFALGFSFGRPLLELTPKAFLIALAMAGYHALSTIGDYEVDKKAGDKTIAVAFGKRTTAIIAATCFLLAFIFIQTAIVKYTLLLITLSGFALIINPSIKLAAIFAKLTYLVFLAVSIVYILS